MKRLSVVSTIFALGLVMGTPSALLAHVGHGDEFQAEGGVDRVAVNPESDALLGIQSNPIAAATDGSGAVLIPMSALVEDNGRQLVFVKYGNFYEPVDVTTGDPQGELIAVTEGLSVGENLVTQGSLSLYAESRKTKTADAEEATPEATATPAESATPADVTLAETAPDAPETAAVVEAADISGGGFPLGLVGAIGAGVVVLVGAGAAVMLGGQKPRRR